MCAVRNQTMRVVLTEVLKAQVTEVSSLSDFSDNAIMSSTMLLRQSILLFSSKLTHIITNSRIVIHTRYLEIHTEINKKLRLSQIKRATAA